MTATMSMTKYLKLVEENKRLRAALASIPKKIGHMRETHSVLHKAEHAQSWGDGYTTAQQIALNIANGVIEQNAKEPIK